MLELKVKKRKCQLIKLLSQEREFRPMSYYGDKLNVSSRTIANDLNDLDELFKKYSLTLKRRPNYGVLLQGKDIEVQRLLMNFNDEISGSLLKERYERQAGIVKEIVLEEKVVTYEELSDKLYINSSVIYKDMANLKKFQNSYCKIISDRSGTRVEGTEYGKQKLLKEFFNCYMNKCYPDTPIDTVLDVLKGYFPEEVVSTTKDIVDSLCAILKKKLEDYYLNSLFIFLITVASRKKQGKNLVVDFEILGQEGVELLSNYHLAVEIGDKFKERLGIQFTKNEIDYISYQLFMHRIELSINNKYLENMFSKDIQGFIKKISRSVGLDLSKDNRLYDALVCHMIPMIYRARANINIKNPILKGIKNNYPVLFNLTWFHLNDLANKYNIVFTEDEVSFVTIHLQVAIERVSTKGRVIVVCETGLVTSELLVNRIRKSLPSSVEVKVVPLNRLNEESMESVDFVISTIDLKDFSMPYIRVSPLVDDEELREIYNYYLKYSGGQVCGLNNKQKEMKLIPNLISLEHIYIENGLKTKDECLDYLFHKLYKAGFVGEKFRDDIYARESLGSTYLSSGVSVPHAMPTHIRKSSIPVLLLPNGVYWDNNIVHLVIMLAVKEEDMKQMIEDLPVLYKKVLDYQFVNDLVRIKNSKDIQKILLE